MKLNKRKAEHLEGFLGSLLDVPDTDILVARKKECELLFANSSAQNRLPAKLRNRESCLDGYAEYFPRLCDHCPNRDAKHSGGKNTFETTDKNGRFFSATFHTIDWLDGKPATILYLRDVDEAQKMQQKLYNLAYMDHLTEVPNRQKFKEDFEEVRDKIEGGKLQGIVSIFDLDNFKSINDTYGHNTGDIMLKRLAEHLSQGPAFKNHIYRLGGDEFVLFFADAAGRFATQEDLVGYYDTLLQGAFLTYTMPNIELSCTISMGVASFPLHGNNVSELLRKADIALYRAKSGGRNQLIFFEDQYDTAKKFKDLYINIQPILTPNGKTYGYELVDRGNEGSGNSEEVNLPGFDRTMDALGLSDMESKARYFIAYSNQLLSKSVLNNLPKDKFVIEMSAEEKEADTVLAACKELKAAGYQLAAVNLREGDAKSPILALADYGKFEAGAVDGPQQKQIIAAHPGKKFIAAGVGSVERLADAQRKGYKLFQGYFFEQPVVVKKTKDIDPMKVNYLRLLKLTSTDDYVDFHEIGSIISSDVALSYKLLRLLNSAAVGLRNQISSIDMAVAYLGEEHLKKWIGMLALRGLTSDKPLELVRISLIRAQFGELLAPHFKPKRSARHVFLVGMFSLLHIALEQTREEMLAEIPVAPDIRDSLLTQTGPYSDLLPFFKNYEYANWDEISKFAKDKQISARLISDSYISAVKWYNQLADSED